MDFKVVNFKPEYGKQLAAMDRCWADESVTPWRLEPNPAEFFENKADSEGGIVKVLLNGEEPVGFIWGDVGEDKRPIAKQKKGLIMGYVDSIYIRPGYRGRGLGKELMRHFEESCVQAGCSHIELIADNIDPERITSFYEYLGYRTVFRRMRKELG